jgi:tetratricopeptide (TPR) repeat protein
MLSIEHLSNLITKNKKNPTKLVELANNMLEDKTLTPEYYRLILDAFEQALRITPRNMQAIFGRGRAKALLGYTSGALLDYNAVIQMRPEIPGAWFRRGLLYFQIKDYKSAVMDFVQVVTIDPNYVEGYLLRAYALINLGSYEAAAHDLNFVIKFETPLAAEALYHRAKCFYNLQLMDLVIKDCNNLLEIGWTTPEIYNFRAMASLHLRNFQDAIKDCEEALKLDPNNEDLLHNKTEILKAIEQLNNEALRKAETQEITTDK